MIYSSSLELDINFKCVNSKLLIPQLIIKGKNRLINYLINYLIIDKQKLLLKAPMLFPWLAE